MPATLPADWLQIQGVHDPLRLYSLLRWLIELRKVLHLGLQFHYKRKNLGTAKWRDTQGPECRASVPPAAWSQGIWPSGRIAIHQPRSSSEPEFWGRDWLWHDTLSHWPHGWTQSPNLLRGGEVGLKFQPSNHTQGWSFWWPVLSWTTYKSILGHLIRIKRHFYTRNARGFEALCQELGTKIRYILYYITVP